MANYTKTNLKGDIDDSAKEHGLAPNLEVRFATGELALLVFGAPNLGPPSADTEPQPGWWTD